MKIAIPRYGGRISPRFGFTEDILIVDLDETGVRSREVVPVKFGSPSEIPEMMSRRGVHFVLTGGINLHCQGLFRAHGIEVLWGLIGTPEEALDGFLAGEITSGMGPCPFRRQRHRHGRGRFWG